MKKKSVHNKKKVLFKPKAGIIMTYFFIFTIKVPNLEFLKKSDQSKCMINAAEFHSFLLSNEQKFNKRFTHMSKTLQCQVSLRFQDKSQLIFQLKKKDLWSN